LIAIFRMSINALIPFDVNATFLAPLNVINNPSNVIVHLTNYIH
jgi:hypothetical protein